MISQKGMENSSAKLFPVNTVVVAMYGATVGQASILKIETTTNQAICGLFPNNNVLPEYLYYFFLAKREDYLGMAFGSGQPNISQDVIKRTLIPIPPFEEQKKIALQTDAIVSLVQRYDSSQARLDKLNNEINDRLRKSILQEAIQGRLVPQDPNDEPASLLLDRFHTEKQKLLKEGKIKKKDIVDSAILKDEDNKYYETIAGVDAEIELPYVFPESWAVVRLQSICALLDGEKRTGKGICLDAKYLRGKSSGDFLQSGKHVNRGDNIILVDGENSGEVFSVPIDGYMGSTFKQLWISHSLYEPYVLECIRFYKDELRNSKKGAAIPHLNKDIFKNLIIGIPPFNEQHRIVKRLNDLYSCL